MCLGAERRQLGIRQESMLFQAPKTGVESLHIDPRYYQLVVQITLLLFGILQLQFEISPMRIAAVVAVAWLLQLFSLTSIS